MPRFDSPLGSKKVDGPTMKEFSVSDESGPPARQPVSAQTRRQRQLEEATQLDIDAIRRFQNQMNNSMPISNGSVPSDEVNLPPQRPQQRFGGIGNYEVQDLNRSEMEIREIRELQRGRGRLNEGARRRIEILLGMVRDTREVDLPSGKYVLQTLRSQELREAIMATEPFDGTVQGPFEIRRQLLARSVIQVASAEIEQFLGTNDLEAKLEMIDLLPESLLSRLHNEYNLMVAAARDKYAIKSEEDAKQVLEDLKK